MSILNVLFRLYLWKLSQSSWLEECYNSESFYLISFGQENLSKKKDNLYIRSHKNDYILDIQRRLFKRGKNDHGNILCISSIAFAHWCTVGGFTLFPLHIQGMLMVPLVTMCFLAQCSWPGIENCWNLKQAPGDCNIQDGSGEGSSGSSGL